MFIFYLFVVSALGFLALYIGAAQGFHELAEALFSTDEWASYSVVDAAATLSYALVATLVWAFHWRILNSLTPKLDKDSKVLPHFYLFGAGGVLAFGFYLSAGGTLANFFRLSDGYSLGDFVSSALMFVLTIALWIYHLRIFQREYQDSLNAKPVKTTRAA